MHITYPSKTPPAWWPGTLHPGKAQIQKQAQ
jgi:hypothetical protein